MGAAVMPQVKSIAPNTRYIVNHTVKTHYAIFSGRVLDQPCKNMLRSFSSVT
ncbi:hypothetical protein APHWI1_0294 [Anaplasma phagocytophilum str. ApWI1]|uniref:Uncharacterized protein n=2 Tax=Anaplasma phagocytophilum TaxID=948 RepID=A0A0F3N6F9_ANAPH|nr:hypothetical protein APHWEB_1221 [Anaplasma phagocytophilum str. Webster]KJV63282.1 hypothetical protein EPHNCH_1115 [Anaplasma phagocytophilum str. NCH-1]KJV83517.1 hypothetical protein APHHGE2_1092 [Anaplasma phagocytophilum str. HGE2]KJV84450.1 hypothetical protein APHWI1_0294 [Anaplasma phagocytophilum str. ApWI1]KJV86912.1 hypothetical protein APHNYW_0806 [Anaplasma phagocytophilum str. ApNYW]KJV98856.1 hypothetical protein OTSANNIE_1066 [Anaplasma phagocytophilum str. Annie]KKA00732.